MKNLPSINSIALITVAFFLGFNFYQDNIRSTTIDKKIEVYNETTCATLEGMDYEIDSLHKHIGKLATATIYLDSCQQQKVTKVERAERRGRFVGGLLKGLFPF